ncbi:DUF3077 domain-containing protein [Pseudomonas sp. 910_21]|uniref:DUF3077 domain-containing protein n=1 Tax=Pseudomonas sp. 910_21 TaxID=2604460 RepID=UPI004062A27F
MNNANPPQLSDLKTIVLSTFLYCSERPLFQVSPGLLSLAKAFAEDAAYSKDSDRHAWAAHYLTAMGKAVVDDVVQALAA